LTEHSHQNRSTCVPATVSQYLTCHQSDVSKTYLLHLGQYVLMGGNLSVFLKQFLLLKALRCHSERCQIVCQPVLADAEDRRTPTRALMSTFFRCIGSIVARRGGCFARATQEGRGGAEWEWALKRRDCDRPSHTKPTLLVLGMKCATELRN
jgi:hypothetical protein